MCTFVQLKTESKWSAILGECLENASQNWKIVGQPIVIIGTTSESGKVPASVLSCFRHKLPCKVGAFLCSGTDIT